mmetsp:Transcript_11768/g.33814  ORF Transcript_11768/g.33814 Transcript_11768/m.33814 type:complete len:223 (-) Transcript_11768:396-1064(-)
MSMSLIKIASELMTFSSVSPVYSIMRLPRSPNIQLFPAAPLTISYICRTSRPALAASARASAATAMWTPARSWWTILTVDPIPTPPLTMWISVPMARKSGSAARRSSGSPEHIMVISPARARTGPPDTGQSKKRMPLSANLDWARLLQAGVTVEETMTIDPFSSSASRWIPSRPSKHTDWHCASFTKTIKTTSVVSPWTKRSRVSCSGGASPSDFPTCLASS